MAMANYSVVDARNNLPRLIDRAIAGEEVVITRHGKPVVEVRPKGAADPSLRPPYDYEALRRRREARGFVTTTSVDALRAMYEEGG